MKESKNHQDSQRGVALIFALLAILMLSILAAGIMSTSQSQTRTALNYRMTTQARYAAEAGVQRTMNWLASPSYTIPANFAAYDMTKNPVQYNGNPVVLSAVSGVNSNYPDATVVNGYSGALNTSLPGVANASYATYATLLRMTPAGGASFLTASSVVQTWQITSVGNVGGINTASVQVTQMYERTGTPVFGFGLEATGTGCGTLTFGNGSSTDSYNSSLGVFGGTNVGTQGNIGTNGNVSLASTAKINGTIAAENALQGACASSGLTDAGTKNFLGLSAVSPPLNPPLPWGCTSQPCYPPGPLVTATQNISTGCASIAGCTVNPKVSLTDGGTVKTVNDFTLAPGSYGNVQIAGADVVHVSAGTYNINSINFALDGQFVVDSGPVIFNLVGNCASGCPTEAGLPSNMSKTEVIYGAGFAGFNGCAPSGGKGVIANPNVYGSTTCGASKAPYSGIPSNLQMVYGGTDTLRLGGMPNATVLYAPSAGYYTPGAPVGLYGSAVVKNFNDQSGSPFHYDLALQNTILQVGQYRPVGGFSWSKF
jgi:Tfp pilus assembly protein PilX